MFDYTPTQWITAAFETRVEQIDLARILISHPADMPLRREEQVERCRLAAVFLQSLDLPQGTRPHPASRGFSSDRWAALSAEDRVASICNSVLSLKKASESLRKELKAPNPNKNNIEFLTITRRTQADFLDSLQINEKWLKRAKKTKKEE